jgi:NAD-dependent deacetylase
MGDVVDRRVGRVSLGYELPLADHTVLVAKARPAQVDASRPDREHVVEAGRAVVLEVDAGRERLDSLFLNALVPACERVEIRYARLLEPDDESGVMGDPLRVRLREPDPNVVREGKALHAADTTLAPVADAVALARMVEERQPCVALTGAGISTESGIPDFRSATGIWARYDPAEVATIEAFRRRPEAVWDFYRLRLDVLGEARPNSGHLALAELERRGLLRAVITQNVDSLHLAAGSRNFVEVHGSISRAVCPRCGGVEEAAAVHAQLAERTMPRCRACGEVLKPGVVMFGEVLPERELAEATRLARDAELMLVVGSTLEVWPVAGLAYEARRLAIVNRGPTALDERADLRLHGGAGAILGAVVDALG